MTRLPYFRSEFTRSMVMAAFVFRASHALEELVMGLMAMHTPHIDPTGFIPLSVLSCIQGVTFFGVGWPLVYLPAYWLARLGNLRKWRNSVIYLSFGGLL